MLADLCVMVRVVVARRVFRCDGIITVRKKR
jgi:hypothetical protein